MSKLYASLFSVIACFPTLSFAEDKSDVDYSFYAILEHETSRIPTVSADEISLNQAALRWSEEFAYGFLGNFTVGYGEIRTGSTHVAGRRFGVDIGYAYRHKAFNLQAMFGYDSFSLKDDVDVNLPELKWNQYSYRGTLTLIPHFAINPIFEYQKIKRSGDSNINNGNFENFDQDLNRLVYGIRIKTDASGEVRAYAYGGDFSGFLLSFGRKFY